MRLEDILKQPKFNLPYLFTIKEKLSIEDVKRILLDYRDEVFNSADLAEGIFKEKDFSSSTYIIDEDKFKDSVKHITDGIIDALDVYLDGNPSGAYKRINDSIASDDFFSRALGQKIKVINKDTYFYRLRTDDDKYFEYPLTTDQVFHVPFQKRYLISPMRFSISGYPSLYISGSLTTACAEMEVNGSKKKIEDVKVSGFKNLRNIKYIDLAAMNVGDMLNSNPDLSIATNGDKIKADIYEYGVLFPLVAACHTKINYDLNNGWPNFKIEYIIPQIILQWAKLNNTLVDGIRYYCNRVTPSTKHQHDDVYNYVFPVRKSSNEGYCDELRSLFIATDIIEAKSFAFNSTDLFERIKELQDHIKNLNYKVF